MDIIITGASGFVGTNLSEFLRKKGHSVTGFSIRSNWKLSKSADALIHLAGKAHDTENVSKNEEYFQINTVLTKKIFDDFLKSEIRDFFFFSSVKAVADSVEGILDEEIQPNPKTPYGKSKLMAEEYILSKKIPKEKRVFIIRPCMIHGLGNKGNLNLLYKFVSKGIPWPLAMFQNERSFLGIDNLCFMMEKMLENHRVSSGIYNFADDSFLSINDLIELIATITGKKVRLMHIQPSVIRKIAKVGDVLHLPINSERLKKLTESYRVSNSKIKNSLEIERLPLDVTEGMVKTLKSFGN